MDPTIVVALIAALAGIVTTVLQLRQRKQVGEVHEQVKNTHSTNLREDMDKMANLLRHVRGELAGLRRELRQERAERFDLESRYSAHLSKHHGSE